MQWSQEEQAWAALRPLGEAVVPFLREAFPLFRKWQGRTSLVYHAIRYARISEDAFQLGLMAITDKSVMVRYRGCGLLAYSLRTEAVAPLERLLDHPVPRTDQDIRAALDAIRSGNHHRFVDRDNSGMTTWRVNEND